MKTRRYSAACCTTSPFLSHVLAPRTCLFGYSIWSRGHASNGIPRRKTLAPSRSYPWPCEPVREWTSIQLHNRSIRLTAVVLRTPLYMMPPFRKTPDSPLERSVKKHKNQRSRTNPFILWDPLLLPRSIDTTACPRVLSCNTKCCPNIKYGRDGGQDEDDPQRSDECWYHEKRRKCRRRGVRIGLLR